MTLKRIMVHAEATPEGLQRARTARKIAEGFKADLEGLAVSVLPDAYGPGAAALQDAILAQRKEVQVALSKTAEAIATETGAKVHSLCTHPYRAGVDSASAMRSADLIIVGPPLRDGLLEHDDIFHAALFLSGRPCLVLPYMPQPYDWSTPLLGQRILVAWKDLRECARAVHDAEPFLERAGAIGVVSLMPEHDPQFLGQAAFDRVVAALRAKRLPVESAHVRPDRGGVHHAFLREANEFRADMLVMGGYGHARFTEFLFGGMTQSMLTRMQKPILMSH